jgi:hypothetical protein
MSIIVHPSTPYSYEAFTSASSSAAGNAVRFTVVSRDEYGNALVDPALKSAFLLFPQNGSDAVAPVFQTGNEVHYQISSKRVVLGIAFR